MAEREHSEPRWGADDADALAARSPGRHRRIEALAWSALVLLLGLATTAFVDHQQTRAVQAEASQVNNQLADKAEAALLERLRMGEGLLRATQSLYLASEDVTRAEFATFYTSIRPRQWFPDLVALSIARPEDRPDGRHYVLRWVEPVAGTAMLPGLDVGRQQDLVSLLRSRDTDHVAMSVPFVLHQIVHGKPGVAGITLRLPLFGPGPIPATVAERRAREEGSVSISFAVRRLIADALPFGQLGGGRVRVTDVTSAPRLLYDSAPPLPVAAMRAGFTRQIAYGGRRWRITLFPGPTVVSGLQQLTLVTGATISLLMALLLWSFATARARAQALGWRMSHRYREAEERFRALNDRLPAMVLLARPDDGRIVYANHAACRRFGAGVTRGQLDALFETPSRLESADDGGEHPREACLHDAAGTPFWASVAISTLMVAGVPHRLLVGTDISELRRLTDELSHQASHDALTGLCNRLEFEQRLRATLATFAPDTPPVLLMYLDLDQFKLVNDTSGHLAGDQLLIQLAAVMHRELRDVDVLARLGGDEFGVLAYGVDDHAAAVELAERLRRSVDGHAFSWEGRSYFVSVSIGGVLVDGAPAAMQDLLAQADAACYLAKEQGRNRVQFHSATDGELRRRHSEMAWAQRLRHDMDENRLLLAYQEVKLHTTALAGAPCVELLLRLRGDDGALLTPGVFLPAAERYGLMPAIDRWVVRTALAHVDQLHPAGAALARVAINLSGASIEDAALAAEIVGWLREYRVDPRRVYFEITETVAVRNLAAVERFMNQLRAVGCCTALDDFGAGMSSFAYLKHLPVDLIKIDGSFVHDMRRDPVSRLMVRAVTDIAHQLGLLVVAEWVEDQATVDALAALGVDALQGFLLHRPELVVFQRADGVAMGVPA